MRTTEPSGIVFNAMLANSSEVVIRELARIVAVIMRLPLVG